MTQPDQDCPAARAVSETVATLTVQLAALRGSLALSSRELHARIDEIAAEVSEALNAAKGPAALCWDGISPEEYARQQAQVVTWARDVLLPGNPLLRLPDCWPGHRDVLTELGNAMTEWTHIYAAKRPSQRLALDYFDRWLPGILKRTGAALDRCRTAPGCFLTKGFNDDRYYQGRTGGNSQGSRERR